MSETEPTAAAPKPKRKPQPNVVNGITVPHGATRWRVWRFKDPSGKSRKNAETCAVPHKEGGTIRRIEWIPCDVMPPDWGFVLATWGSGTYRIQFWGEQGSKNSLGISPPMTFDDPAHPQRPSYVGLVPDAPAAAGPARPADATEAAAGVLFANAEDGKIPVSMALLLFQMQSAQLQQQREWAREREVDDRRRRDDLEADHQRRLQQRTLEFEQERQRAADFWANESKRAIARMQELAEATREQNGDEDRFDQLAESLDTLAERVESKAQSDRDFWQGMVKEYAPLVIARFAGGTPAMGPGGNGSGG